MYAAIRASGKKNRLRMKKPKKLWPLRPATRAGQKARLTQMTTKPIARIHQPSVDVATTFTMLVPPSDSGKGQTRTDPASRASPKRDDSQARDATVARREACLRGGVVSSWLLRRRADFIRLCEVSHATPAPRAGPRAVSGG